MIITDMFEKDGKKVLSISLKKDIYYTTFLIEYHEIYVNMLNAFVSDFYNVPAVLKNYKWKYIKGRDIGSKLIVWTYYQDVICASGMLQSDINIMNGELINAGYDLIESNGYDDKEDFYKRVIKTPVEKKSTDSSNNNGSFCRACNYFNKYAEVDNVVEDDKHTCWNCATSFERIRIGLSEDFNIRSEQVLMIKKINNIKGRR